MRKRILLVLLILVLIFVLVGCGITIPGKYVSVDDVSEYIVFENKTFTHYYADGNIQKGEYESSAKSDSGSYLMTLIYDTTQVQYWILNEDKNSLYKFTFYEADDGTKHPVLAFTKDN